jgi:hypothetical protein
MWVNEFHFHFCRYFVNTTFCSLSMIYSFSSFSFISMIYSYLFLKFILDATSWVTFLRVSNFIYILYVIYILMRQCAAFHIIWYLFRLIVTHGVPLVEQEILFPFRSTWFHSVFFVFWVLFYRLFFVWKAAHCLISM